MSDSITRAYAAAVARLAEVDAALAVAHGFGNLHGARDKEGVSTLEAEQERLRADIDEMLAQRPDLGESPS